MRFLEKCTAGLFRLPVCTHCAVSELSMGLMMMSIAFSSGLSGSGCTVHDSGFGGMVFFGCALQKTEVLESH